MNVEYGDRILEFPDSMTQEEMGQAIRELPEEKKLAPRRDALPPAERYKTGIVLNKINPTIAKEVRRIALEKQYGYIAKDPFSVRTMIGNIPENVEEIVSCFSTIIAQTGLFAYRFGRNVMQDGNESMRENHHPILPGMGPRVQEQFRPAGNLLKAIYADWQAMFAGEVSDEIGKLPVGQARDAIWEKIERQGLGDSIKYFIQDNPVDALLIGSVMKTAAAKGSHLSLTGLQRAVPKGSKMAKALDSALSTKRTPIIYSLGPEKNFAKLSAKVQKDTVTMLKPTSDIGGMSLDEIASLAAVDPIKAVRHVRRAKVPFDRVAEGLRNKGAKVVVAIPKTERAIASKNLQLTIDRIEKFGIRKMQAKTLISKQVNVTRKTGGSTFNTTKGDLIGSDNYAVSIFPDYSKIVNGKVTGKQLTAFYLKNEEVLLKYPELAVGTWYEGGQTYIDFCVTIPTANKFAAIGLANKYNQRTVSNLKTLEKIRTEGTGKGLGDLPNIEQRMKDIRRISPPVLEPKTGIAELHHWSGKQGLREIDPAFYGTGLKGAEGARKVADPKSWVDRSYYGIKDGGYVPEAGPGATKYSVDVSYKSLYDFNGDPLRLRLAGIEKEPWELTLKQFKTKSPEGFKVKKLPGEDIARAEPDKTISLDPEKFFGHPENMRKYIIEHEQAHFIEERIIPQHKARLMDDKKIMAFRGRNINEKLANMIQDNKLPDYVSAEYPKGTLSKITKKEQGNPVSLYEKAIKERGYKGYYVDSPVKGNVAVLYYKTPVKVKPKPGEKIIALERKYSDDILTKYIFEKTFDAALEKFPVMRDAFATHKAKKLVNTLRNLSDEANFNERAKVHEDVYKQINKLSKEEQAIIVPYLEGRAQLVNESSEQFKNFEHWYRGLVDDHEAHLWKIGKLPESTDRLYQPMARATGQSIEKVRADMGTFTPVYVHHTFPQMHDAKMGIHFADTTGKRFQPGFMKKCQGVQGYSENFKEILPKYTSEYIKFKHTEKFISDFTEKFGIRANLKDVRVVKGGLQYQDKLYANYKVVAPDGYLSYYRGKIDLQREILKRMENTTFDEAIGDILAGIKVPMKEYVGVSKNKVVYLVPEKMVGELESFATPVFGSQKAQDIIRLVVDKPTQVWKDSVLAVSPRWIKNNVMGDIIFNTFEGVGPLSYSRAFRTIYKDCIPDELLRASFANVMKYNPKLGKTAKTVVGKYVQTFLDTKVVGGIAAVKDTGYALNTMFEQPFVRALYVKLAREQAVKYLKAGKMPRTEANILARMRVIKGDEILVRPLVNKVHEILPVFNLLGNFERKYIRRFVPFVNWYKFMVSYGAKLPAQHPFKLVGARGLGALSEEHREQVFKDYFPFMAREIEGAGIPNRFDHMWPIGQKGDQMAKFFNVRGANPFTTISDFVNLDFMNMASPILTVPIEQMTGRAIFGNRKFESGEAGVTVTHKGVEYKEFAKVRPPLVDHIMSQLPQYTLLKKWLVPARQWDTGTMLNPDPILNPDTGEYVYPIESLEKILNMLGVDQKTLDVQKMWYQYQARKAQALGRALTKHREHLSFEDIRSIMNELQADTKLWKRLKEEMDEKAYYEEEKTREFMEKVR